MSEPKEYRFTTVAEMAAMPPEKWADMLADFASWLDLVREVGVELDLEEKKARAIVFDPTVFVWVDDGLREMQRVYVGDDRFDRVGEDYYQLTDAGRALLAKERK